VINKLDKEQQQSLSDAITASGKSIAHVAEKHCIAYMKLYEAITGKTNVSAHIYGVLFSEFSWMHPDILPPRSQLTLKHFARISQKHGLVSVSAPESYSREGVNSFLASHWSENGTYIFLQDLAGTELGSAHKILYVDEYESELERLVKRMVVR
jgi:hypothetical protein